MALPAIAYKAPPTVARFIKSDYRQTSENGPGPRVCFIKGPVGCLPAETEYLSPTGWRAISDYDGGLVGEWQPNGLVEFIKPEQYVVLPQTEPFHRFQNTYSVDMVLSGEHRVPFYDWKGALRVETADYVAALMRPEGGPEFYIPTTYHLKGETHTVTQNLDERSTFRNCEYTQVPATDGKKYCFVVPSSYFVARHNGRVFITGNSGKSVGCCVKILRIAMTQAPGIDGIRKTRFTVVRNTRDQLKDTTLKTWLAWFPNGTIGNWKEMDRTYYIKFVPPDGIPVESEVMFRALDDPDDVAKVLSLEVTAFFFNECREIVREIAENAISRAGRYPDNKSKPPEISSENWPTWYGVFGDTNAPEMDSYWANVFEHLPVDDNDPESVLDCETFSQPPGDSEEAENIDNLPGKRAYYARGGRSMEWYRTMVQVKYGRSLKGRPVYEDAFKEEHLSSTPLKIDPYAPVVIGLDTARTPAAVFMQRDPITGRILKQREAVAFGMGAKMFIKLKLRPILRQYYPNNVCIIIGDPSFKRRNETDDNSWYKVLKDEFPAEDGHLVKEASTNDSTERINALDTALSDFPRGVPLVQYDPSLKWCREGLRGKYRYLRVKGSGEKFQASPDKNNWSHVIEADQYGTMFINSKHYRPEDYVRPAFNPFARQQSSSTAVNYHAR